MKTKKIKYYGVIITVDENLTYTYDDDTSFTKEQMQKACDSYKGMKRIHKPVGLLFWQDVKNGKSNRWKLIK